jgi:hypothetical protein
MNSESPKLNCRAWAWVHWVKMAIFGLGFGPAGVSIAVWTVNLGLGFDLINNPFILFFFSFSGPTHFSFWPVAFFDFSLILLHLSFSSYSFSPVLLHSFSLANLFLSFAEPVVSGQRRSGTVWWTTAVGAWVQGRRRAAEIDGWTSRLW